MSKTERNGDSTQSPLPDVGSGSDGNREEMTFDECRCPVCMEPMVEPLLTNCDHRFCLYCLARWFHLRGRRSCPSCRSHIHNIQPCPEFAEKIEKFLRKVLKPSDLAERETMKSTRATSDTMKELGPNPLATLATQHLNDFDPEFDLPIFEFEEDYNNNYYFTEEMVTTFVPDGHYVNLAPSLTYTTEYVPTGWAPAVSPQPMPCYTHPHAHQAPEASMQYSYPDTFPSMEEIFHVESLLDDLEQRVRASRLAYQRLVNELPDVSVARRQRVGQPGISPGSESERPRAVRRRSSEVGVGRPSTTQARFHSPRPRRASSSTTNRNWNVQCQSHHVPNEGHCERQPIICRRLSSAYYQPSGHCQNSHCCWQNECQQMTCNHDAQQVQASRNSNRNDLNNNGDVQDSRTTQPHQFHYQHTLNPQFGFPYSNHVDLIDHRYEYNTNSPEALDVGPNESNGEESSVEAVSEWCDTFSRDELNSENEDAEEDAAEDDGLEEIYAHGHLRSSQSTTIHVNFSPPEAEPNVEFQFLTHHHHHNHHPAYYSMGMNLED